MKISKEAYVNETKKFVQELLNVEGAKMFIEASNFVLSYDEAGFNDFINEYEKLKDAYELVLNKVYDCFESVVDMDTNIDENARCVIYLLADSKAYTCSDEDNELVINIDDETLIHYIMQVYYIEWAKKYLNISEDSYYQAYRNINNDFMEENK